MTGGSGFGAAACPPASGAGGRGSAVAGSNGGDSGAGSGAASGGPSGDSGASQGGSGATNGQLGADAVSLSDDASADDSGGNPFGTVTGDGGFSSSVNFPDAGVVVYPDDPAVPAPLPHPPTINPDPDGKLALTDDANLYSVDGCGEPPLCFMRISVLTEKGHVYSAIVSASYPKDNCARDVVDDKKTVLIGDTYRSEPGDDCADGSRFVSVAFFLEPGAPGQTPLTADGSVWKSDSGFKSEWQIANGQAGDNGSYYPAPGDGSRIQLFTRNGSEAFGQLQVPIVNKDTGMLAVGYLEFDVFVRPLKD